LTFIGGPFGVEPSVKAAGNLYAIIGFAVMPFVWALPECLITYELSALYPCASGGVRWVEEAFGVQIGLMFGYLSWLGGVINGATYPVLFFEYVMSQFYPHTSSSEIHGLLRYGILFGMTLLLSFVNYRGLDVVGKTSIIIFVLSMSPFVIMIVIGFTKVDPEKWLQTPRTDYEEQFDDDALDTKGWFPLSYLGGIVFRPFVNNLYWNFNNFDQAGHYSGAVPQKTLQRGIAGSLLLVSATYLLPILVTTGATDIRQDDWTAGTLAVAGTDIAGRWLGNWIVVSAAICLIASFFAELSADSMQLMGMSDRSQIPSIFSHRSKFDTPSYAILMCLMVMACVLPLSFHVIVELTNFSYCIAVTMEFLAFAQLRIRGGDATKGRKIVYVLVLILPMLYNILVVLLASYATYIFGISMILFGFLLIKASQICDFCCGCIRSERCNDAIAEEREPNEVSSSGGTFA
jgi:amino acid transporter